MKHLLYLRYLIRHKWYVLLACFSRGLYWQGIIHDWSKFLPSEWGPYSEFFYGFRDPKPTIDPKTIPGAIALNDWETARGRHAARCRNAFDIAWLKHQHRNPHHWQHWVLREDSGDTKTIMMPEHFRLEMLADWEGAGRAITGRKGGTPDWYAKNRNKIQLHPWTRTLVDSELNHPFTP